MANPNSILFQQKINNDNFTFGQDLFGMSNNAIEKKYYGALKAHEITQDQYTDAVKKTEQARTNLLSSQVASSSATQVGNSSNINAISKDYQDRRNEISRQQINKISLVGKIGKSPDFGILSASSPSTSKSLSVVTFDVTPELSESGQTILMPVDEIRSAASLLIYLGSPSRTFTITSKLVSRTAQEADANYTNLYILKAWRMPAQDGNGVSDPTGQMANLMNNPEVLRLFAYSKLVNGVPVAMQSIDISYPEDVDYVYTTKGIKIPIIMKINMSFREVRNFQDMASFSYGDYKSGKLAGW